MYIEPPKATGFNFECLGALLLPLRPPQSQGLSMTLFVNMFFTASYTCNDISAMRIFRAQFGECPACDRL